MNAIWTGRASDRRSNRGGQLTLSTTCRLPERRTARARALGECQTATFECGNRLATTVTPVIGNLHLEQPSKGVPLLRWYRFRGTVNGGSAGLTNQLYFTAGPRGETGTRGGLFGKLSYSPDSSVPEPSTIFLLGMGLVALNLTAIRGKKRSGFFLLPAFRASTANDS